MTNDEVELIKRRLVEDVTDKVRGQLFRTYSIVGLAVVGVMGFIGWDFFDDTREEMRTKVEADFEQIRSDLEDEIDELKLRVAEQTGRISSESDRAKNILSGFTDQISTLATNEEIVRNLNETVSALQEARRSVELDIEEIKNRIVTLDVLAEELKNLAETLVATAPADSADRFDDIAASVQRAEDAAQRKSTRTTVFLQFAGGARTTAQALANQLSNFGFVVPGEERHAGAAGKREVRYFYDGDREEAERLAKDLAEIFRDLQLPSDEQAQVIDLTAYSGPKPREGILELWVEL
jgi:hypothetical protein